PAPTPAAAPEPAAAAAPAPAAPAPPAAAVAAPAAPAAPPPQPAPAAASASDAKAKEPPPKKEEAKEAAETKESAVAAQSIRVNVDLLENLMTMVSELVLTRNQLMQILRSQKDSEFTTPLQHLSHVTTELQEGVMKTRMQPIGNAWAKLPRIVRDLALVLEISDDGRGLALEKIKKKAVASGLASETELAGMTDQQIQQFIFKAGFSTASQVTSVSGRGVGMDVVRTNIEKIGGTIELKSQEGKGSSFIIKIPLTLAIVSALIVECTGEKFAIPQISVVELVRAAANSENRIERVNSTPVLRLRNKLLPLVSLQGLLKLGKPSIDN